MGLLTDVLGWGSPIGLGFFLAAVAVMLFLLASTIDKLAKIDQDQKKKK